MSYTDNLNSYKSFSDTQSCYLDGRYFNKVVNRYPGLIREPLSITIRKDKKTGEIKYTEEMKSTNINNKYPGLLRVIINTPNSRHSNLVIIDYAEARIFRFDPYGKTSPYFDQVNKIIEDYLDMYIDFNMYYIDNERYDHKNINCTRGGFCVGYVIKYAYDYLNGLDYDPSDILKFSAAVENVYGPLSEEGKDIEYGFLGGSGSGRNVLIGVLGGIAIGGLVGGGRGAVVGGALGGLGGALI